MLNKCGSFNNYVVFTFKGQRQNTQIVLQIVINLYAGDIGNRNYMYHKLKFKTKNIVWQKSSRIA